MNIEAILAPMRAEHASVSRRLEKGMHSMSGGEFTKLVERKRHLHCALRINEEFVRTQLKKEKTHATS